jgi:hypothetical protein
MPPPSRNAPCPCGSGKKYKKCCLAKETVVLNEDLNWLRMRRTEGELLPQLLKHAVKHYGPDAIAEAWDEYSLWSEAPMEPETEPELDTSFLPWFVYNWAPDNAEREGEDTLPEVPVAEHYLAYMGDHLDSYQCRFIVEACSREYSFFMVTDTVPGKYLSLRDMMLKQEVTVHEQRASTTMKAGDMFMARVVTIDGDSIMLGCAPYSIPASFFNDIIEFREDVAEYNPLMDHGMLRDCDIELRDLYYELRDRILNPVPPLITNTDGDPLQMTKLVYRLHCTPREAVDALLTLSLDEDADELLQHGVFDADGELQSIEIPWLKEGNKQHPEWENTVLGHMDIDGDRLTVEVNSQSRADIIRRKLNRRLGRKAEFRNAVIESLKDMHDKAEQGAPGRPDTARQASEDLMATPEGQAMIREMAAKHWEAWPDISLPALNGETPREAAKTDLGRERLEALLLSFESSDLPQEQFRPDIRALRRELGLE